MKKLVCLGCFFLISAGATAGASPITINFEQFADGTQITTQYVGLTFTNALELTAGVSLNTADFPPHSGSGVITNDPDQDLSIVFATPQNGISVYYTDPNPSPFLLTVTGYDASHNVLGSATGVSNLGMSSLLSLNLADISSLVFRDGTGTPDQFVLDDLTYGTEDTTGTPGGGGGDNGGGGNGGVGGGGDGNTGGGGDNGGTGGIGGNPGGGADVVPEPGTLILMGSGMVGLLEMVRRRLRV